MSVIKDMGINKEKKGESVKAGSIKFRDQIEEKVF